MLQQQEIANGLLKQFLSGPDSLFGYADGKLRRHPAELRSISEEESRIHFEALKTADFLGLDGNRYPIPFENPHSSCAMRLLYSLIFLRLRGVDAIGILVVAPRRKSILLESDFYIASQPYARYPWHMAILTRLKDSSQNYSVWDRPFFDAPVPMNDWLKYLVNGAEVCRLDLSSALDRAKSQILAGHRFVYAFCPGIEYAKALDKPMPFRADLFLKDQIRFERHLKDLKLTHLMAKIRRCCRKEPGYVPDSIFMEMESLTEQELEIVHTSFKKDLLNLAKTWPEKGTQIFEFIYQ